ncbi:glycosyl hydrolase family 28-related protein [Caldicellulosiruptor kronotskyensis]|uniref:glycosyl hydrolase family 28-related protein n=1 Tax=Caldicellulosiruptor kronotskyensis TaxID=413889 RepID=UPI0001E9AE9A|nr:glycosyl hydrolase family 28-related protein [Caldicellulosiruptor kronotskyensis]
MRIIVTDFGAKGDGVSFCTEAIQKAIDTCFENGGGVVVIPAGIYLSRPIRLKSNVTLYLEEGAVIKATNNIEDYYQIGYYHNELLPLKKVILLKISLFPI